MKNIEWTHQNILITDIRKIDRLYVLQLEGFVDPLFVSHSVFEERLKSYYLKDNINNISRENVLKVIWNFYITKGYYIKINNGSIVKQEQDPNKFYISFLDVSGPLGKINHKEN